MLKSKDVLNPNVFLVSSADVVSDIMKYILHPILHLNCWLQKKKGFCSASSRTSHALERQWIIIFLLYFHFYRNNVRVFFSYKMHCSSTLSAHTHAHTHNHQIHLIRVLSGKRFKSPLCEAPCLNTHTKTPTTFCMLAPRPRSLPHQRSWKRTR